MPRSVRSSMSHASRRIRPWQDRITMMFRLMIAAAAAGLTLSSPGFAQGVIQNQLLSAEAANAMVMEALAQCRKDGYKVSAAVVDRGGNLLAFIRDPATA